MVEGGMIPTSIQNIMTSVALEGNPWNEPRGKRKDWARIAVKAFTPDTEWLYFSCCTLAYDPAEKKVAQTTANILRRVGVDFGILGTKESCCSESIRKVGAESLFQQMAKTNINVFMESGVKKILVSSPHCYTTFKNEYPEFGGNFEVTHVTQLLAKLLSEGRLNFSKELNIKVAYHDPCYLGRHNDIYDEPRQVLRSILGLELIEFPDNRENGVCCGGGGGGLWKGSETTESLSDLRVRQAIEAGANVLAVACPYCMINFEDSIKTAGKQDVIEVKDVTKLVEEAM
jgi:Fe-S oxidoreductase